MKSSLVIATCVAAGLLTASAQAQAPGSTGPTPQAPAAVPLDGGASLLAVSGVAYGLRHLRQRRKAA